MKYFKNLIPTFGKHSLIMLTYCNGPKVGIKLLKISHVRISFARQGANGALHLCPTAVDKSDSKAEDLGTFT